MAKEIAILRVLSKSHSVAILFFLAENGNGRKYTDMMYSLRISPRTLSRRLDELQENRIIEKNGEFYTISERGKRILHLLKQMAEV